MSISFDKVIAIQQRRKRDIALSIAISTCITYAVIYEGILSQDDVLGVVSYLTKTGYFTTSDFVLSLSSSWQNGGSVSADKRPGRDSTWCHATVMTYSTHCLITCTPCSHNDANSDVTVVTELKLSA